MTDGLAGAAPLIFARSLFLPEDLGGNRYPYEVVRRLGERGHPVTVVTPRLHRRLPPLTGVTYRTYPVTRRHPALTHLTNLVGATRTLHALPRAPNEPRVLISGSYDTALAFRLAGLHARMRLVFLFHSEFYSEWVQALGSGPRALAHRALRAYMAAIERQVFDVSDRVVAVSAFSAEQVRSRAAAAQRKVRVIPTGVDTTYFSPVENRAAARDAIGQSGDHLLVLGTGRLVAVKRFDRLIAAIAAATQAGTAVRLVLAGDGPDREALAQQVDELGIAHLVHFAGFCDPQRLRALMRAADLQVCSSAFENFSLAILEAFACGTPVLGTPGGGTPELVGRLDPQLVLADDRVATMAEAIGQLARNRDRLQRLGARARHLAVGQFDWSHVVDQLEALCAEL